MFPSLCHVDRLILCGFWAGLYYMDFNPKNPKIKLKNPKIKLNPKKKPKKSKKPKLLKIGMFVSLDY